MDHTVLQPVGVTVTGLGLRQIGPAQTGQLVGLLAEYGVVILPDQGDADDSTFLSFLRGFGDLTFTTGETPVPGCPDLNVVSNVGRTTAPKSSFHVDTSYIARPPAYTALRAVSVPAHGGATQFSNQYRAYDTLPDGLCQRLVGRTIRHVVTGLAPGEAGGETAAEHPVFRRHPVSGRTALYLSAPARCVAVSGMSAQESADVVHELFEHSTRADNVMCHAWSPGDVVIWDNACVLHRADHTGVVGDRVMHRGMVAGGPTVAA